MNHEPRTTNQEPRTPRIGLWILVTVLAMVALQVISKRPEASRKPGPARGDLVLGRDSLPATMGEWQKVAFKAAPAPEDLAQGQYWWVHQWNYTRQNNVAIVSFDQLGENQWHELTYCYRNQNRTIEQRDVFEDPESGGKFVVATMRGQQGDLAVLVFSVFFEDGQWATPPGVNLGLLNAKKPGEQHDDTIADRARRRFQPTITFDGADAGHDRALQCQVLIGCDEAHLQATIDSAIELHLASRSRFRDHWLVHVKPSLATETAGVSQ
jgi:hypothetical protein